MEHCFHYTISSIHTGRPTRVWKAASPSLYVLCGLSRNGIKGTRNTLQRHFQVAVTPGYPDCTHRVPGCTVFSSCASKLPISYGPNKQLEQIDKSGTLEHHIFNNSDRRKRNDVSHCVNVATKKAGVAWTCTLCSNFKLARWTTLSNGLVFLNYCDKYHSFHPMAGHSCFVRTWC